MLTYQQARLILSEAELIHSAQVVSQTVQRLAADITQVLSHQQPLVLCVMGGAVVFTGQLLPLLRFPLDFDYLHLTRYDKALNGGEIHWQVEPREQLRDRSFWYWMTFWMRGLPWMQSVTKCWNVAPKRFIVPCLRKRKRGNPNHAVPIL